LRTIRVAACTIGCLIYPLAGSLASGIKAGGPQEGCSYCEFRQPEIFNQFLGCEDYIPAQRRQAQPSGGSGKKIRIERRQTEVDRVIGPPRPTSARDEAVQMIEEALTEAAQKVAGPANQAKQIADHVITTVFKQIRERVDRAQERGPGEKKSASGHVNAADRRTCAVCGQRL
jgi:vacuolar-type H+-ATPase subunit H